ncbi:MAG: putative porin [Bacteroidales bacterium]
MKKILLSITLFVFSIHAYGQVDSTRSMSSWMMSEDFFNKRTVNIDTAIESFQQYNPVNQIYFSHASLGNYGSPVVSNTFSERPPSGDLFFLNNYYPYLYTWDKTLYVNTKRQFTKLFFVDGGSKADKEENFEVFHTQNINPDLNFGFRYNTVSSLGQYRFQRMKRNSFSFFSSYNSDFYKFNLSVNTNNIIINHNGGIVSDTLLLSKYYRSPEDLLTVYSGSGSPPREQANVMDSVKNINLILVNNFNLTSFRARNDTLSVDSIPVKTKLGLMLITNFESTRKSFIDLLPQTGRLAGFYDSIYFNTNSTFDSIAYRKIENNLRFYVSDGQKNLIYAGISSEFVKYAFKSRDESYRISYEIDNKTKSPFYYQSHEANLKFNSGAIFNLKNIHINLYGFLYLAGYKEGNHAIDADFNLPAARNNNTLFSAAVNYSAEKPAFLYQQYYSNYFNWSNNFIPEKRLRLSLKYSHSPKKFEAELNYSLLYNHVFFDTKGLPEQLDRNISVLELRFFKNFYFWKFGSLNKFALQYVNDETVLGLPNLCFSNSTFIKHHFHFDLTNGGFTALLGFDLFYETKYYGYAYMAPISSFVRQVEKKTGGYPIVDIFLNIKLKRVLFFLKFDHVNSGLLDRNYFSILHYPRNERVFKAGISWNFYD